MATKSKIEWTETTWNPITGCTKTSEGCKYCYAEMMAKRLHGMKNPRYKNKFNLTIHPDLIEQPLKWQKPKMIFVNSMSDLFHEDVDFNYIKEIFEVMNKASQHTFQVLTKRAERLANLAPSLDWPENVWQGVTVENKNYLHRIEKLKSIPAKIRFVSFEPLLGPIPEFELTSINWVIAGGESGPKSRPIDANWIRNIKNLCLKYNTPFFFKQWGGINKKQNGRTLDEEVWEEYPV